MKRQVLPVIHFLDVQTALFEADIAFASGADGVFLISHLSEDDALFEPASVIKGRFPDKKIGLNLLAQGPVACLDAVITLGLDMAWADFAGVSSLGVRPLGAELAATLKQHLHVEFFAGVAFKGQAPESDAGAAARMAVSTGMIATTSGSHTGSAPDVGKIEGMRAALGEYPPLAIASGMAPETVHLYTQAATHFLVSTHVSRDGYHFDPDKLRRFVSVVRNSA